MERLYDTIIVGLNENDRAITILERATELATAMKANLIIISTIPYNQILDFDYTGMEPGMISQYIVPAQNEVERLLLDRRNFIDALLKTVDTKSIPHITKQIQINDANAKLLEEAEKFPNGLIIVGATKKKVFERLVLGSVARDILETSPIDVLTMKF